MTDSVLAKYDNVVATLTGLNLEPGSCFRSEWLEAKLVENLSVHASVSVIVSSNMEKLYITMSCANAVFTMSVLSFSGFM